MTEEEIEKRLAQYKLEIEGHKKYSVLMAEDVYIDDVTWLLSQLKEKEAELTKWNRPHEDSDLEDMREQAKDNSLAAKQAYINGLEWYLAKAQERLRKLEEGIKTFSRESWEEHNISKATSNSFRKLYKLVEGNENSRDRSPGLTSY